MMTIVFIVWWSSPRALVKNYKNELSKQGATVQNRQDRLLPHMIIKLKALDETYKLKITSVEVKTQKSSMS